MMPLNHEARLELFDLCDAFPEYRSPGFEKRLLKLLRDGADPNFKHHGSPCLCAASKRGNMIALELLLKHGASVDIKDDKYQRTPASWAATHVRPEILKVLISHGADINFDRATFYLARGPLSTNYGYEQINRIIVEHGVQVNVMHQGESLFKLLFKRGVNVEYLNVLVDAGASPYYCGHIAIDASGRSYHTCTYIIHDSKHRSFICHLVEVGFKISLENVSFLEEQDERYITVKRKRYKSLKQLPAEMVLDTFRAPLRYPLSKLPLLCQVLENMAFDTFLASMRYTLLSLAHLCRVQIRHELALSKTRVHIRQKIDQLPLPPRVKTFLKLDDIDWQYR